MWWQQEGAEGGQASPREAWGWKPRKSNPWNKWNSTSGPDEIAPDMPNSGQHWNTVTKGQGSQCNCLRLDVVKEDRCHLVFLLEASALHALKHEQIIRCWKTEERASCHSHYWGWGEGTQYHPLYLPDKNHVCQLLPWDVNKVLTDDSSEMGFSFSFSRTIPLHEHSCIPITGLRQMWENFCSKRIHIRNWRSHSKYGFHEPC